MVVMVAIMTIMMMVMIILSNMVMMVMKIIFSIMMMVIIVVMAIIFMVHARIASSSRRASIAAAWVTAVPTISRIAADSSMYAVIWVALHAIARVASIHAIARIACALHAIARVANTKALIMTKTRSAIHMSCISHIYSLLHIGYSPEYENIL